MTQAKFCIHKKDLPAKTLRNWILWVLQASTHREAPRLLKGRRSSTVSHPQLPS
ncbi:unnamed protein product [Ixodes pacificus]